MSQDDRRNIAHCCDLDDPLSQAIHLASASCKTRAGSSKHAYSCKSAPP